MIWIVSASLFFITDDDNPDVGNSFDSIPYALFWTGTRRWHSDLRLACWRGLRVVWCVTRGNVCDVCSFRDCPFDTSQSPIVYQYPSI